MHELQLTKTLKLRILLSFFVLLVLPAVTLKLAQAQQGVPDNLVNLSLDPGLVTTVNQALPESSAVNAAFLNPSYDTTLSLSANAHISATFVDEGAGYRNTLGYFSFTDSTFDGLTNGQIDSNGNGNISLSEFTSISGVEAGLVFPNFSGKGKGGHLEAGDSVVLGGGDISLNDGSYTMTGDTIFNEDDNIGFFVAANAWQNGKVKGWNGNSGETPVYYSLDFLNPENSSSASYSNPDANTRHVATMFADTENDEIIIGFEDLNRATGDNDFNDAVFIVRSDPVEALSQSNITTASAPAPTLGGLTSGLLFLAFFGRRLLRKTSLPLLARG